MTHCKAIMIAAPSSGSGKTLLTLALLRAFRNAGLRVASAKAGPDYIDPPFHEAATARPCYNLDPWAMPPAQLRALLAALATDADLVIVEGVMGLFDGPASGGGSSADLALTLGLPVLLTVDCRHQAQSAAALVHGFASYRPEIDFAGVLLNRVASPRHEALLRAALGSQVIGVMMNDAGLAWPSRHLGLVQAIENPELESFIAKAAAKLTDEDLLARILDRAAPVAPAPRGPVLQPLGQHMAIARDQAFSFLYPHLLDSWRQAGAELSFFSPLADEAPDPAADAVFLPGGYPELHAGRIAAAGRFLTGLTGHTGLIYGECGGFMVLGERLTDADGQSHQMAGLLPLATSFAERKLHLGYRRLTPRGGAPWQGELRGHEFHYSTISAGGGGEALFAARDAAGAELPPMGLRRGRVMGSYAHVICEAP